MAGALTPEFRHAVLKAYGSVDNAIDEACMRSDEISELWQTRYSWPQRDFWERFWQLALPVLGIPGGAEEVDAEAGQPIAETAADEPVASVSKRGRRTADVSVIEASMAARIYFENRAEFDARDDGGAYAVHKLYTEDDHHGLSRPMIGHLLDAIREGWLPWDAKQGQLRISDEFRTRRGRFVIPRRKPAS